MSGENLWLKEFLDLLAIETGLPAPRRSLPNAVIRMIGCGGEVFDFLTPRSTSARVCLETALQAGRLQFFSNARARRELGGCPRSRSTRVSPKRWRGFAMKPRSSSRRSLRRRWDRMFSKVILALWSAAGLIWWMMAWRLVAGANRTGGARRNVISEEHRLPALATSPMLSVFKPLPPLSTHSLDLMSPGLESFVAQLDSRSEMLIGIHEQDREVIAPLLERLQADYPCAKLKVIFRADPDGVANPKIAWQRVLAGQAEGELWLWSDADIVGAIGLFAIRAGRICNVRREDDDISVRGPQNSVVVRAAGGVVRERRILSRRAVCCAGWARSISGWARRCFFGGTIFCSGWSGRRSGPGWRMIFCSGRSCARCGLARRRWRRCPAR